MYCYRKSPNWQILQKTDFIYPVHFSSEHTSKSEILQIQLTHLVYPIFYTKFSNKVGVRGCSGPVVTTDFTVKFLLDWSDSFGKECRILMRLS